MFSADWSLRKFIILISSYMVLFFDSARVALHESQFQKILSCFIVLFSLLLAVHGKQRALTVCGWGLCSRYNIIQSQV